MTDSQVLHELLSEVKGINTRLDGIDGRLDGIDNRLDGMDTKIDRLGSDLADFREHME